MSFALSTSFDFLTFLLVISAVFTSIYSLRMSFHSIDLSAMFPRPSASSMRQPFMLMGEFGVFGLFEGVLIDYAVFAVRFAPIPTITVLVRVCVRAQCTRGVSEPLWLLCARFSTSTQ